MSKVTGATAGEVLDFVAASLQRAAQGVSNTWTKVVADAKVLADAKVTRLPVRHTTSITARPPAKPSGQQVVARIVDREMHQRFSNLSEDTHQALTNCLRGVLDDDPRIQNIASKMA